MVQSAIRVNVTLDATLYDRCVNDAAANRLTISAYVREVLKVRHGIAALSPLPQARISLAPDEMYEWTCQKCGEDNTGARCACGEMRH